MSEVIVIGSGVIGLSSALELQAAGYSARILTRDLPGATTSLAAGALWSATDLEGELRRWAEVSLERYLPLTDIAGSGVTMQRFREVYAEHTPTPWYHDRIPFCQPMNEADLPAGMRAGYYLDLPIIAPPLYLDYLQNEFESAGGRIERRTLTTLGDVADEAPVIVNCSGVGARELAADSAVYPIRGQTMLVDAPQIEQGFMYSGDIIHIFPRADGVLLGGIKRANDWDLTIDPSIATAFLERCVRIEPSLAEPTILRQFSGLRPGRHQVRLDVEALSTGSHVIHNYGHAAIGYTLSWGCAADVVALARQVEAI